MRTPAGGARFAGVEGLRGLAAASVLAHHVWLYADPTGGRYDAGKADVVLRTCGTAGVVLFFVLSAFLLWRPFAAAVLADEPGPRLRSYVMRRALRVLPAYWLALLGAGLVLRSTYLPATVVEGRSLASEPGVLVANLLLVQGLTPGTLLTGIGPAWSLAVEVVFYAVLPLLAAGALLSARRTGWGRRRRYLAALAPAGVLLAVGEVGLRVAFALPAGDGGTWAGSWHAVAARSFMAFAALFAGGVVLAVVSLQVERGALVLPSRWRVLAWGLALVLGAVAVLALDTGRIGEHRGMLLLSVAFTLLLALVVLPARRPRLATALSARPLHALGLVSYGVFLWNEPVAWWLRLQGWTRPGSTGFLLALGATSLVSVVLATASWRIVERPALRLGRPRRGSDGLGRRHRPGRVSPVPPGPREPKQVEWPLPTG